MGPGGRAHESGYPGVPRLGQIRPRDRQHSGCGPEGTQSKERLNP